jgi:site-specific recombinase XerC
MIKDVKEASYDYFDSDEVTKLRKIADKMPIRDRATIYFLMDEGVRMPELVGIQMTDVDL